MRLTLSLAALLSLFLVRLGAQTQTYPLLELSKKDSAKARAVHDKLAQSQKSFDSTSAAIWHKYIQDPHISGFGNGRFSDDYRFFVGGEDPAALLELSHEDTEKMIAVRDSLAQAKKDWEGFHRHILQTYVATKPGEQGSAGVDDISVPQSRQKFMNFRFTQDYRFIIGLM